jgi:hypothetical protein
VALSLNTHDWETTHTEILMGGPIQGGHPDKQCGLQYPTESKIEDGGGTSGLARTLSGNGSG